MWCRLAVPRRECRRRRPRSGLLAWLAGLGLALACTARPPDAADGPDPAAWAELEAEIRERYPGVSQVSTRELAGWLQDEVPTVLLDGRAPEEFAVSHLEGALLAPDEERALEVLSDVEPDRRVVVYCSVGYRSSDLAAKLERAGYTNVHNLEGSIFAWANEGRPVVDADGPTDRVHPYDREWGRLLERDLRAPLETSDPEDSADDGGGADE